jgi:hypothetical protein
MEAPIFLLAEAANISREGKVNLLGAIIAADEKLPRDQAARVYENERKSISVSHPDDAQVSAALQTVLDLRREFAPGTGSQGSPAAYYDASFAKAAEAKT